MNDFRKYATKHLGMNGMVLDDVIKAQAQYGMNNIPEEYIENYAKEILKKGDATDALVDRSIDRKLAADLQVCTGQQYPDAR